MMILFGSAAHAEMIPIAEADFIWCETKIKKDEMINAETK